MLKAAWKSLLGRKVRLVMSTFAIVLGVAFVAGTFVFTDTLSRSFTSIFDHSVGDVVVRPAGSENQVRAQTSRTLPASLVARLAKVPGAARADGNVVVVGVYVVDNYHKVMGGQGPPAFAFSDAQEPAAHGVAPLQVVSGHRPHGPNEVAIDAATVQRGGFYLGQTMTIISRSGKALLHPRLVGIADYPGGGGLNGATITIWDTRTAQRLFLGGRDVFDTVWVTARPGVSQQDLLAQVRPLLPKGVQALTGDAAAKESASRLLQAIQFITYFLLTFALISLVVGAFLIANTFSMLVAQRSRELALLRALGASRCQVTATVLFEALVLALVGSAAGLGLGVLLAIGIRALFARFGLDLSGTPLVFAPRTFWAAFAVGVPVTLWAAYRPGRRAGQMPPVAALRDDVALPESSVRRRFVLGSVLLLAGLGTMAYGLEASVSNRPLWVGAGALAALVGVLAASPVLARPLLAVAGTAYRLVFGAIGRLAGQNARRNPRRTAATAGALTIGLALVSTFSIAGASASASVDQAVRQNFAGDLAVNSVVPTGFNPDLARVVARTPGVGTFSEIRVGALGRDGFSNGITGVDPSTIRSVLRLGLRSGSLSDLGPGSVLVSNPRAVQDHLKVGDRVVLDTPDGKRGFRVAGVFWKNPLLFYPYLSDLGTLRQAGFAAQDLSILVKLSPGADAERVRLALERRTRNLPTVSVVNQQGLVDQQRKPIDQLITLIYALLGLALVIAVLGVVNTLGLSVIERTREVGLLRAIGMTRAQLRRMIVLESVVISVLGAVLGVGLGVLFGVALTRSLRDQGLTAVAVPVRELVLFVAVAAVVGVLAAALPARRAARLDVLTAIATE